MDTPSCGTPYKIIRDADPLKILFAASELYPLVKTGGLGDVAASLPDALARLACDVKIMLPAYRDVLAAIDAPEQIATFAIAGQSVRLLRTVKPGSGAELWLLDHALFDRAGNPYLAADGSPWPDNAARFALFCRAIAAVALDRAGLDWRPDVVHCNDWQTGLAPALLHHETARPALVFTIHNLAYSGLFPRETFTELGLPAPLWSPESLEFYGQLSFMKGGLVYAERINAVSPGYAREIQTPAFGCGFDGLLRHRCAALRGIVNGIDTAAWDPARDSWLVRNYGRDDVQQGKRANKTALQRAFKLPRRREPALIGMIGRLVEQKGIDLLLGALPVLLEWPLQIALLGTGQPEYEQALQDWAQRAPDKLSVRIGYDEALAHRIEAGADIFLMPSRFEPCGLNQMYSQRYGTVPVVRRTGGLQDTVTDANDEALTASAATGVIFDEASAEALIKAIRRALTLRDDQAVWRRLQDNGMAQDFSWQKSAGEYIELYRQALAARSVMLTSHGITGKNPE
jgi:starch synthase